MQKFTCLFLEDAKKLFYNVKNHSVNSANNNPFPISDN